MFSQKLVLIFSYTRVSGNTKDALREQWKTLLFFPWLPKENACQEFETPRIEENALREQWSHAYFDNIFGYFRIYV